MRNADIGVHYNDVPHADSVALRMNLINGMETTSYGFIVALVISVCVSGLSWFILRHKRLL